MENKKKSFFLGLVIFCGLLLGARVSKAMDCYEACANMSDPDTCFASCSASYSGDNSTTAQPPSPEQPWVDDYSGYEGDGGASTYGGYSYAECIADGGDNSYCSQFSGAQDYRNYMSAGTCKVDADCNGTGSGFECYNGTCVDSGTYGGTTSWTDRLWEGTKDLGTSLWDGTAGNLIPSWSIGKSTGNSSNPAAVSGTPSGGLQINLPGINYGGGNYTSGGGGGGNFAATIDPGAGGALYNGANPAGVAGAGIFNQPKCGTSGEFQDIGGVCFPTQTGLSEAPVEIILANIFGWLMGIFTTLSFMAFVISGIQYLTSAGDDAQIKTAKTNAKWSVVGIIVGLSGYIVVKAVSAALSGQSYFF